MVAFPFLFRYKTAASGTANAATGEPRAARLARGSLEGAGRRHRGLGPGEGHLDIGRRAQKAPRGSGRRSHCARAVSREEAGDRSGAGGAGGVGGGSQSLSVVVESWLLFSPVRAS